MTDLFTRVTPALTLPRYTAGSDFGTERKLLARFGTIARTDEVTVWWWTGHSGWCSVGRSKFYTGTLNVSWWTAARGFGQKYETLKDEDAGSTRLAQVLKAPHVRTWLHTQLLPVIPDSITTADLTQIVAAIDWRATIIVRP